MHINVPVVMFHSVMTRQYGWCFEYLTEVDSDFERKLAYLKERGYETITLKELYNYMKTGESIPSRAIVLTFDDGYLDNWVVVFPLLKKYGFTGVVFVNCDFVDPNEGCRYNLEDLWSGRCSMQDIKELGYLSWAEMREMEKSGAIDIQSHSLTHTWYFKSDKILDFHHPGDQSKYPWLAWNARPDKQYRWMTDDQERFVPYGAPIYDYGRSLGVRRYYEDGHLRDILINHVKAHGDLHYFEKNRWREELFDVVAQYCKVHALQGRYETEEDYKFRVRHELSENKRILEERLNKKIEFLCWPGGAYNETSLCIARDCGYLASTVKEGRNTYGDDASKINRISSGNPDGADNFPWRYKILTFAFYLERFRGNMLCLIMDKFYRLMTTSKLNRDKGSVDVGTVTV